MQSSTLAYVLHSRPYKESHLIVDVFTHTYGRMSVMVRNAKTHQAKSRIWQPFILLELAWHSARDLPSITDAEALNYEIQLSGKSLFCGMYLNELLQKLLPKSDPCPALWYHYQESLQQLSAPDLLEPGLRRFEFQLLQELGLGIDFIHDEQGCVLQDTGYYHYDSGRGWIAQSTASQRISGASIRDMSNYFVNKAEQNGDAKVLGLAAKQLTRQVLHHALGGQTLQSRQLFAMMTAPS